MPRRAAAVRRETTPDAKYNNRLVSQLINKVMLDGKKSLAERIVYGAFDRVEEKTGEDVLTVFKKAMDNIRPTLEVKPKRVGGATYQVPMEVNSRRSTQLAIRWLVDYSRKRKEHTMIERLAAEKETGRRITMSHKTRPSGRVSAPWRRGYRPLPAG